jgi:hypothetical protein
MASRQLDGKQYRIREWVFLPRENSEGWHKQGKQEREEQYIIIIPRRTGQTLAENATATNTW